VAALTDHLIAAATAAAQAAGVTVPAWAIAAAADTARSI